MKSKGIETRRASFWQPLLVLLVLGLIVSQLWINHLQVEINQALLDRIHLIEARMR